MLGIDSSPAMLGDRAGARGRGGRRARAARAGHARAHAGRARGADLLPVPRDAPPADLARQAPACSSGSRRRCGPGGRFAWNVFVFNHAHRGQDGRRAGGARGDQESRDARAGRQPDRPRARHGRARSRSGGRPAPSGKGWSTSRGSRSRRSTAGSSASRSTSRATSSYGSRGSPRKRLRLDRQALRPLEPERHRGCRLLRRRGERGPARRSWSSGSAPAGSRCRRRPRASR